ncbi:MULTISPECIES: formyltransferase family protein [Haloferax]|uniref:formyltransferase family protein n=1 Tax=Haloferax TaxID=2251 RepID=UPI000E286E0A|nr:MULTISPECIES: formyltransferase family protein [Haloferax]RDZ38995.1 hypothetical protein C5B89_10635 [Haloferax sp. Atlit-47N]WEL30225.1 Methionyl-tRNA formyltransferase [Haloferax alexandrinus]
MSGKETKEKTVVMLVEGEGLKGRTVIRHLVNSEHFSAQYDLRVVVDTTGKTTEVLEDLGIPWITASDPREPLESVEVLSDEDGPDYLVTCGWAHKVPPVVCEMPTETAINCHSSYLPDYKGLAVYRPQWAHAERYGGASVHFLTEQFDEGNIITQARFTIGLFDTPLDIAYKYSDITAPLLREALALLESGYQGHEHDGGRYYSAVPWTTTVKHGIVNHLLRAVGLDKRWEIEPKNGSKPGRSEQ